MLLLSARRRITLCQPSPLAGRAALHKKIGKRQLISYNAMTRWALRLSIWKRPVFFIIGSRKQHIGLKRQDYPVRVIRYK